MAHTCHATNCDTPVSPELFMCRRHWYMVPAPLRARIWATYRKGQCDDWQPSAEYCRVAIEAVTAVARKMGVTPDTKLYEVFLAAAIEREKTCDQS